MKSRRHRKVRMLQITIENGGVEARMLQITMQNELSICCACLSWSENNQTNRGPRQGYKRSQKNDLCGGYPRSGPESGFCTHKTYKKCITEIHHTFFEKWEWLEASTHKGPKGARQALRTHVWRRHDLCFQKRVAKGKHCKLQGIPASKKARALSITKKSFTSRNESSAIY